MKRLPRWTGLLIIAGVGPALAGCGGKEPPGDAVTDVPEATDASNAADAAYVPPTGRCGMPQYALLDRATLGKVVASESIDMLSLDADTIESLLASAGFSALGPVPYGTREYRFRYSTQDRGQAIEATALLAVPVGEAPLTDPVPVLMYAHGTTGFSDPCAPGNEDRWFSDAMLPAALASQGFVVIAPDYIGMNSFGAASTVRHGYLVGEQTAIGAWDAVRGGLALLGTLEDAPAASNRIALWGASQGGHAVLFTELWAPYYAPEFDVAAVVAVAPATDLLSLMAKALQEIGDSTGLFAISLLTLQIWYGRTADLAMAFTNVAPHYFADNAEALVFPENRCSIDLGIDPDTATLDLLFDTDFTKAVQERRFDDIGPWNCYYQENSLGTSPVLPLRHTPTLMVYAENDTVVDTDSQKIDFEALCSKGYRLDFLECRGAGHTQAALWSLPEQLAWIRARLAGTPVPDGETCTVEAPVVCSATPAE